MMHMQHAMPAMTPASAMRGDTASMGMATPEQMTALAAAKGPEFDRQFLERHDHPPPGRGDDGRGAAQASGCCLRPRPVPVRQRRDQRPEGRDQADERAARRAGRRSALKPEARPQGRRAGDQQHARRCLATQADGLLRPRKPGRPRAQAGASEEGREAGRRSGRALPAPQLRQHRHGLFRRPARRRQLSRLQPLSTGRDGTPQAASARPSAPAGRAIFRSSAIS